MSNATVVFADGSKAMAHNLDDLRERWLLRKSAESTILKKEFDPTTVPDYSNPTDQAQALEWWHIVTNVSHNAQAQLAKANVDLKLSPPKDKWRHELHRAALVAEYEYHRAVQRSLKTIAEHVVKTEQGLRSLEEELERNRLFNQLVTDESLRLELLLDAYNLAKRLVKDYQCELLEEERILLADLKAWVSLVGKHCNDEYDKGIRARPETPQGNLSADTILRLIEQGGEIREHQLVEPANRDGKHSGYGACHHVVDSEGAIMGPVHWKTWRNLIDKGLIKELPSKEYRGNIPIRRYR